MGRVCGAVKWRTIKGGEERAGRVVKVENSEPKASERNNSTNWYFFESASRRGDVEGNKGTNEPTMTTGVKGRRRGGGKTREERRAWKAEREREREREREVEGKSWKCIRRHSTQFSERRVSRVCGGGTRDDAES